MNFLSYQIKNFKMLEAEANAIEFIKNNNITKETIIFTFRFSKDVYKTLQEVLEFLKERYYYGFEDLLNISETPTEFLYNAINLNQSDKTKEQEIELRRGVTVVASEMISNRSSLVSLFNNKNETLTLGGDLSTIDFSDKNNTVPNVIELACVVKGKHSRYGDVEITKDHLKSFVKNFNDKVTGLDIAINEDHKKNEAFGWIKSVFLSEEGEKLYGNIVWNSKGTLALSEKEYRYISPEFTLNFIHEFSKKKHGPTLTGAALTNYPFLKMEAIIELSEKKAITPNIKKGKVMVNEELQLKLTEQETTITNLSNKLDTAVKTSIELNKKVEELVKEKDKMKQDQEYKELFDKGVINAAQLTAVKEGKSLKEILELSQKTVVAPTGKTTTTTDNKLSEQELNLCEKLGLSEEDFLKYS